ncbi:MAG: class I SAM-dependent methyltransferase [Sedimentisphaerales bacterium]|nr:class I SAM-dependent methyltransferase [Sedimentisphaerales bacterium]
MAFPFNLTAKSYDQWYDTFRGRQIFDAELECLQSVSPICEGRWLEVGVGTGRFASRMGIKEGIDSSAAMLELAAWRGITTYSGYAEDLPFEMSSFGGILMTFTLCFIELPEKALNQCQRVLKPDGQLLIGLILADGPWGKAYQEKKNHGHPIYSHARFLTIENTIAIAKKSGFGLQRSACTLFFEPDELPSIPADIEQGISEQAGFAALLFSKVN